MVLKDCKTQNVLREHRQKTFVMLNRIWSLRWGWGEGGTGGGGCLSESVKKGKFVKKIFFSDNVE